VVLGHRFLVGLGANLPSRLGSPVATLEAALAAIEAEGATLLRRSGWYESAPVPPSDQPWYVNGVALVSARLGPAAFLH
jgi:2-amino-4-hydroxy-6-hydroxymethyldihydropteridine diphosphokinase